MKLDYIEIGTSDFDALVEKHEGNGISIEPLKFYLDALPKKENNIKINAAVSNFIGKIKVYYIHPNDIKNYNLPSWVRGCNSISEPHPQIINLLNEMGIQDIFKYDEIDVINWDKLIKDHNITQVNLLKIDTEGHDHIIIEDILNSNTNILPKVIFFETNVLTSDEIKEKTLTKLFKRGYKLIEKNNENTKVELSTNLPQKIIFASNDSSYLDFWKVNSEICSKVLKITPVLLHITNEDSDFYWDDYGLVKKIKNKLENTILESQVVRLYSGTYFENEIIIISDIDMLLFDKKFLENSLKNSQFYDVTILGSDAYDKNRPECEQFLHGGVERFAMSYLIMKGEVLNKIMNITKNENFLDFFIKNNFNYNWDSDEVIFTKNLLRSDFKINRILRGFKSRFYLKDRIEKHMFTNNDYWKLNLNEITDLNGFIECHCANYKDNEKTILRIRDIILNDFT